MVVLPLKLSKIIIKRTGYCLYSEYKIQGRTNKRDSYCASYCLYIIHLTKVLEESKNPQYKNLEDMVYRMQLTYDEVIDILDLNYILSKRTGYSLPPGMNEITVLNTIPEHILPDNVKVTITIDDIRLKSNWKVNQTLIFKKNHSSIPC